MLDYKATDRVLQVGLGGVGAAIAQSLNLISQNLFLVDGDTYEPKNEARQAFSIGNQDANKAELIAEHLKTVNANCAIEAIPEYITDENWDDIVADIKPTLIVCCVDNDAARELIFDYREQHPILWAANEIWDPQAGLSTPKWSWNPMEFFQAAEGNNEGCGVQTVHANIAAASMALQLLHTNLAPQEADLAKKDELPVFEARVGGRPYQLLAKEIAPIPAK